MAEVARDKFEASVRASIGLQKMAERSDIDVMVFNDIDRAMFELVGLRAGFYHPWFNDNCSVLVPEADIGAGLITYLLKLISGKNVNFPNRDNLAMLRRKIGVVFQDFRLLDHLSAFDNVALPLRVCGMDEREVRKRVSELLSWVELDRHMLDTTATLSGGEKQRIAIARAVINRPELLLADEPTGNVDNDIAPKLMKLFVELNKLGTTVVIATHSEKLINDFAYPRLHLQNHGLHIYYPSDVSKLGGAHV